MVFVGIGTQQLATESPALLWQKLKGSTWESQEGAALIWLLYRFLTIYLKFIVCSCLSFSADHAVPADRAQLDRRYG